MNLYPLFFIVSLICPSQQVSQPLDNKSFNSTSLAVLSMLQDLVQEVRGYKDLVSEQAEDMKKALDQLEGLKNRMDVIRSEVRLISQHKLTWQNSTYGNYESDFLVDGVYRLTDDKSINPIQMTRSNPWKTNEMVMIDLGARFKIHTIKLWRGLERNSDHRYLKVQFYADDTKLWQGYVNNNELRNVRVQGEVYGTKIYVKQMELKPLKFLEIQVFGTGPFGEDEI